ncbi:hypothetical protein [uncultured Paracoccus sp.]|uniref:hypothetical protein n=1 Tax=uncultured Paracoccus sp. TaxID=189685 RepID=UPI0025ED4061|nr:hypothetical protein [uncultured Paracoccus sp.]
MKAALAILILGCAASAQPVQACGSGASSTFCADGWVAQQPAKALGPQGGPQADGWSGDGTDPAFVGDDGVYVEGAVVLDDPPPDIEEPL